MSIDVIHSPLPQRAVEFSSPANYHHVGFDSHTHPTCPLMFQNKLISFQLGAKICGCNSIHRVIRYWICHHDRTTTLHFVSTPGIHCTRYVIITRTNTLDIANVTVKSLSLGTGTVTS